MVIHLLLIALQLQQQDFQLLLVQVELMEVDQIHLHLLQVEQMQQMVMFQLSVPYLQQVEVLVQNQVQTQHKADKLEVMEDLVVEQEVMVQDQVVQEIHHPLLPHKEVKVEQDKHQQEVMEVVAVVLLQPVPMVMVQDQITIILVGQVEQQILQVLQLHTQKEETQEKMLLH